jgi:hypothetical protein
MEDMRRDVQAAVETMGDAGVTSALRGHMEGRPVWSRDDDLEALTRRFNICGAGAVYCEH